MEKTSKTSRVPRQLELAFTQADSLKEQARRERARRICERVPTVQTAALCFTAEVAAQAAEQARQNAGKAH